MLKDAYIHGGGGVTALVLSSPSVPAKSDKLVERQNSQQFRDKYLSMYLLVTGAADLGAQGAQLRIHFLEDQ